MEITLSYYTLKLNILEIVNSKLSFKGHVKMVCYKIKNKPSLGRLEQDLNRELALKSVNEMKRSLSQRVNVRAMWPFLALNLQTNGGGNFCSIIQ